MPQFLHLENADYNGTTVGFSNTAHVKDLEQSLAQRKHSLVTLVQTVLCNYKYNHNYYLKRIIINNIKYINN